MKRFPLERPNGISRRLKPIRTLMAALVCFWTLATIFPQGAKADEVNSTQIGANTNKIEVCRNGQNVAIPKEEKLYFDTAPPCLNPKHLFSFTDEFERNDSKNLGSEWLDCHTQKPVAFEPLGIRDGGVVVPDPFTRPGVYDTTPPSGHPPTNGRLFPGIGCAYIETGTTTVSVKVIWSGNWGVDHAPPLSHVEGTPLLYVTPSNPRYGFGAWTSQLYGVPVIFAGYIAAPVENFEVITYARLPDKHVSGTPREIELRAEEPGKVTVWVDGKQVSFEGGVGLTPISVDPTMIHSTLHGFAVDAHLVDPPTSIPTIKSIEAVTIRELK
jgi:hypothetical protein